MMFTLSTVKPMVLLMEPSLSRVLFCISCIMNSSSSSTSNAYCTSNTPLLVLHQPHTSAFSTCHHPSHQIILNTRHTTVRTSSATHLCNSCIINLSPSPTSDSYDTSNTPPLKLHQPHTLHALGDYPHHWLPVNTTTFCETKNIQENKPYAHQHPEAMFLSSF